MNELYENNNSLIEIISSLFFLLISFFSSKPNEWHIGNTALNLFHNSSYNPHHF